MSTQKSFNAAMKTLESKGIVAETLLCTVKAQAVAVISSVQLSKVILPVSLQFVNSGNDVPKAIHEINKNDSTLFTVLFAVSHFVHCTLNNKNFSVSDVEAFTQRYNDTNSPELLREIQLDVLRSMDENINQEMLRCASLDGDSSELKDSGILESFEVHLQGLKDEPIQGILDGVSDLVSFQINFASTLVQGVTLNKEPLLDVLNANRESGHFQLVMFNSMVEHMVDHVFHDLLSQLLTKDELEVFAAQIEAEDHKESGHIH